MPPWRNCDNWIQLSCTGNTVLSLDGVCGTTYLDTNVQRNNSMPEDETRNNPSQHALRFAFAFCLILFVTIPFANGSGKVWVSRGPEGGDIRSLAINPQNPSNLYAGTGTNGVFKSTDGGDSWHPTGVTAIRAVNTLAIDPVYPTTLYAVSLLSKLAAIQICSDDFKRVTTFNSAIAG
jgi:hypothetical protein